MSVTPDCFEMTLLRSGNETNAKDCSSSSMATAILPVSDVGVVNADVSQTTGDLYLNLLLKSYQDQIATLKDELQERNKLILSLLHSDKNAVKVSNSVESPTSSLKSSTSRTLDKDKNIPWQLPKKAVRIDQTSDNSTIPTANRFFNLADSEWIKDDVHDDLQEASDVSGGRNETSSRTTKTKQRKDVEVERNPEKNTYSPFRKNDNSHESGERRSIAIIGDSMIKDLKFRDFQAKCPKEKIYVKSYPGSTVNDMSHYIQPTANRNPDLFLIHIGTNNLRDSESAEKTANEILELAASVKTSQNEVVISSIITRGDDLNEKAQEVNTLLYSQCQDYNITYLDNSNIEKYNLTYRGRFPGLHLNKSGSDILLSNFVDFINM